MFNIERLVRQLGIEIRPTSMSGLRAAAKKIPSGYLILVNEYLAQRERYLALQHEIEHIIYGHFDDRAELSNEDKEREIASPWLWKCQCELTD